MFLLKAGSRKALAPIVKNSSLPWLVDAEKRILICLSQYQRKLPRSGTDAHWVICGEVESLSDRHDHSIVRFVWQLVSPQDHGYWPTQDIGYAAIYANRVFLLQDELTFVQYLKYSRLTITEETRMHLAVALQSAVLGWTGKKCRMDSVEDMQKFHLNLDLYRSVLPYVAPPLIEATKTQQRLIIWVYHWSIDGMMVEWAVTQSKSGAAYVGRLSQVAPPPLD